MNKTISIYIHIPFCQAKCAYCDFLSAPSSEYEQEQYLRLLMQETVEKISKIKTSYQLYSIFIGGGTPSIVSEKLLSKIIRYILSEMEVVEHCEVTIECNPGTITKEKLLEYKDCGINRLSIGLQSTQDKLLKELGRIHSYQDFLSTYQLTREVGFDNISIDLMFALPGQTLQDYIQSLHQVAALEPEHISAYSLIVEEGTAFYHRDLDLPSEEIEREMFVQTKEILENYGYYRYEISNYSKLEKESKHNLVYWERGNYLGLGLGASSMIENLRYKNADSFLEYEAKMFELVEEEKLSIEEQMAEFMILGLRKTKGVSRKEFFDLYNKEVEEVFLKEIKKHREETLLACTEDYIYLTEKGMDVSNYVFTSFI